MADALRVEALSVRLGARTVVDDVSFAAQFGELLAIVGPNGAGKSSVLRALCGLVPYRGLVELEGRASAQLDEATRARHISFVPQHSRLTAALTVREVVNLGRYTHRSAFARESEADRSAIDGALADLDITDLSARTFPDLSTGEQKRVMLARALCTEARTLLLDEPTASLDIEHALRLFESLRALARRGRAIVLVLHQLEHALAFCDRALLLSQGRVLAVGPAHDVLTPENVRALHHVEMVPRAAPDFRLPERR